MGAAGEAEWRRLRRQLELAEGFWVGFLFAADIPGAVELRRRTESFLRARVRRLQALRVASPEELRGSLEWLLATAHRQHVLWLEALRGDANTSKSSARGWMAAWEHLLLRLNERRDRLRRHLQAGLVLAAPLEVKRLVREAAPDLWSIRSLVVELPLRPLGRRQRDSIAFEAVSPPTIRGMRSPQRSAALGVGGGAEHGSLAVAESMRRAEGLLLRGEARQAISEALQAVELLESSAEGSSQQLAQALAILARAEARAGDQAAARQHIARAIELKVREEPDRSIFFWFGLWFDTTFGTGDVAAAKEIAKSCVALARELVVKSRESPESLKDLAVSLSQLGHLQEYLGEYLAALDSYEESLALHRRLSKVFGEDLQSLRDLSISFENVGDVHFKLGNAASAAEYYADSLPLSRRLLERFGETRQTLADLSSTLERLGDVQFRLRDLSAAANIYSEVLSLRRRVLELGEDPRALRDLLVALGKLGDVESELGDFVAAEAAFAESLSLRRRLLSVASENAESLHDLSVSLGKLGVLKAKMSDVESAANFFEQALMQLHRLITSYGELPRYVSDARFWKAQLEALPGRREATEPSSEVAG